MSDSAELTPSGGDSAASLRRTVAAEGRSLLQRLAGSKAKEQLSRGASDAARKLARHANPEQLNKDYKRLLHVTQEVAYDRSIEKHMFVPTRDPIPLEELTIVSRNRQSGRDYQPVHRASFEWAMAQLPEKLAEYTFVDYGAGRGRALLLAALHDFRRVTGVEFAAELQDDASMNIAQFPRSLMKCRDIECLHMDAVDYQPPNGKGVYFFNNPFDGDVMEMVLARIASAYRAHPRRIYLVFVTPLPQDELDRLMENAVIFEPMAHSGSKALRMKLLSPEPVSIYRSLV